MRNIYEKITKRLNKYHSRSFFHDPIKLVTVKEMLDLLTYLDSLNKTVKYVEETKIKELNFD